MTYLAPLAIVGGSVAALLALGPAPRPAQAAQAGQLQREFKAISHIPQGHIMHLADADNHVIGVYEHQGVALFEDGNVTAYNEETESVGDSLVTCKATFTPQR